MDCLLTGCPSNTVGKTAPGCHNRALLEALFGALHSVLDIIPYDVAFNDMGIINKWSSEWCPKR